jgi:hypothetical protein
MRMAFVVAQHDDDIVAAWHACLQLMRINQTQRTDGTARARKIDGKRRSHDPSHGELEKRADGLGRYRNHAPGYSQPQPRICNSKFLGRYSRDYVIIDLNRARSRRFSFSAWHKASWVRRVAAGLRACCSE